VGSAQWRGETAYLQHGSILVDDDQSDLSSLAADDSADSAIPPPYPATLLDLLGRAPTSAELAQVMFETLRDREQIAGSDLNEAEIRGDALDLVPDYLDDEWTWRR
jgi:hypothetical protein